MTTPTPEPVPLIFLAEDEDSLAQGLLFNLAAEGYRTHREATGTGALEWLDEHPHAAAALLLDVMLPGADGFSIVRHLRAQGNFTPAMMLTARGRDEDVVAGFEAGADDYLSKPFDLGVLLARLAALLRRQRWQTSAPPADGLAAADASPEDKPYAFANGDIDFGQLELHACGATVRLTLMEADLLRYLTVHAGDIVSRKELLENVWHVKEDTDTRAIDNFIVRLRRYMEPQPADPVHLVTVRGIGYRFVPFPQA
jgi:DNA-binding response OmpR family regulator